MKDDGEKEVEDKNSDMILSHSEDLSALDDAEENKNSEIIQA